MKPTMLQAFFKAYPDVSPREDDVVLLLFDPDKNCSVSDGWCNNIDSVAQHREWSSITTVVKAGTALQGSAFLWFEIRDMC